ncbi:MAG: 50S ribosomal protein L32 [Parcubacteria group bacterium]|nr:50S ribosomal protein L32 [Parcubacteria group bacterium]
MVVRMRHTRSHTRNRRSHHKLEAPAFSLCGKCGAQHIRHRVCSSCGTYRGRVVLNVAKKALKKEKKTKQKETEGSK